MRRRLEDWKSDSYRFLWIGSYADYINENDYFSIRFNGTLADDVLPNVSDSHRIKKMIFNTALITKIPDQIDFSGCEDLSAAFYGRTNLRTIKWFNSSRVKDFSTCFYNCYQVTGTFPELDFGNVETMRQAFYTMDSIQAFPDMNLLKCTDMYYTFYYGKQLKTIGRLETPNVTNYGRTFDMCNQLESIDYIDMSSATTATDCFSRCVSLQKMNLFGLGVNLDLSECAKLEADSIIYLMENAKTVSGRTLILPSSVYTKVNNSYVTAFENKGWTISISA